MNQYIISNIWGFGVLGYLVAGNPKSHCFSIITDQMHSVLFENRNPRVEKSALGFCCQFCESFANILRKFRKYVAKLSQDICRSAKLSQDICRNEKLSQDICRSAKLSQDIVLGKFFPNQDMVIAQSSLIGNYLD